MNLRTWLLSTSLLLALFGRIPVSLAAGVTIYRTNYHGWNGSYVMSNGKVAAVVVPSVGRVMQFGYVGEEGVFWENPALEGRTAIGEVTAWAAQDWVNFGGDKTWPAPESDWSLFTNRKGWRPPPAFDGWPSEARIDGKTLVLTTGEDPFYTMIAERRIRLHPRKPELTITTTYRRTRGEPAVIGVWVITQLKEPAGLFARVPTQSLFKDRYAVLGQTVPPSLKLENNILSLVRNPGAAHKIGLEGDTLLWVGGKHVLRIDSPRVKHGDYPDQGSNLEIYTSADPLPYIEMETLGPLSRMKAGDAIKRVNVYTLSRRTQPTAEGEARAVWRR